MYRRTSFLCSFENTISRCPVIYMQNTCTIHRCIRNCHFEFFNMKEIIHIWRYSLKLQTTHSQEAVYKRGVQQFEQANGHRSLAMLTGNVLPFSQCLRLFHILFPRHHWSSHEVLFVGNSFLVRTASHYQPNTLIIIEEETHKAYCKLMKM